MAFEGPRSPRTFLFACTAAMAIGAAIALLRPPPPTSSPGNVSAPVKRAEPVDPRVMQEQLLERMVAEGRVAERPDRAPGFDTFVMLVDADSGANAWVVDRLMEADAAPALRVSFARRLSERGTGSPAAARRLLRSLLADERPAVVRDALETLATRGETREQSWRGCRCRFGVHPAKPVAGEPVWLFARAFDGSQLAWEPTPGEGGWTLQAQADEAGAVALVRPLEAAAATWTLLGGDGSPPLAFGAD